MNNYNNYPYNASQYGQIQQMFPQAQGSVYSINSPIEVGNVPIGSTGLSVALCLNEGLMYIKSFQNGNPIIMAYKVDPYQKTPSTQESKAATNDLSALTARIDKIEHTINSLNKSGGKFDELLQS